MPSLTIKGIPEELLVRLRAEAQRERRSVDQQALVCLERGLMDRARAAAGGASGHVEAWRRLAGSWVSDEPVAEEIRQIYVARSEGRDVES
jgi:hypothetical protein